MDRANRQRAAKTENPAEPAEKNVQFKLPTPLRDEFDTLLSEDEAAGVAGPTVRGRLTTVYAAVTRLMVDGVFPIEAIIALDERRGQVPLKTLDSEAFTEEIVETLRELRPQEIARRKIERAARRAKAAAKAKQTGK